MILYYIILGFVLYSIANSKTNTSIPEINTHPQSESTLINRSIHPNSLTHSHFTFVQSPHSQSSIFCSFRERKIQSFFPVQYSIPNKRKWKTKWSDWNHSLEQSKSSTNQSLYNHIEAFLVICDFISSVLCLRIEKDIEESFSLHKVWISLLSHNEK